MHCLYESKQLMHGKKIDLFLVDVSFFGWHILNLVFLSYIIPVFPIISVWLTPYYGLTQAIYYDSLLKEVTV